MDQNSPSFYEEEIANLLLFQASNQCSICQKTFSTQGNLKNHIEGIHKKIKPFKCSFPNCDKSYLNHTRLMVHERTHTGEKPFKCPICLKGFNEKGNLKTHICFHSKSRPFICQICNKSYKTNGHLKDHTEIRHNNIKKYECAICQHSFGRSSTLKAHIRTHTGEKLYKCPIEQCDKAFAEKGNMVIHHRRHLKRLGMNEDLIDNVTRPNSSDMLKNEDGKMENKEIVVKAQKEFFFEVKELIKDNEDDNNMFNDEVHSDK